MSYWLRRCISAILFVSILCLTGCSGQTNMDINGCSDTTSVEIVESTEEQVLSEEMEEDARLLYDEDVVSAVLSGEIIPIESESLIDLDRDGQGDAVSLKVEPIDEYGYRYRCKMTINSAERVIENILLDSLEENSLIHLFTPDGERLALALWCYDGSYNEQTYVYLYDGQEIEYCILWGRPRYYDTENSCLFVDTLVYQIQWHHTTRACNLNLNSSGCEFVFQEGYSSYNTYDPYGNKNLPLTLKKDIIGYRDCEGNGATVISAGSQIAVLGGDAHEWLSVYVMDTEEELWLHISNGFVLDETGLSVHVGDYFEDVWVVN